MSLLVELFYFITTVLTPEQLISPLELSSNRSEGCEQCLLFYDGSDQIVGSITSVTNMNAHLALIHLFVWSVTVVLMRAI